MPKPYSISFTDAAKAWSEATSSLAAVEKEARAEIDWEFLQTHIPGFEIDDLPISGFHTFRMKDGAEFICWLDGASSSVEIDAVARHESVGPVETPEWAGLGKEAEFTFPVGATKK